MQLKAFKVKMYRPVLDSDWIDVDDITVIVGKNESGKTAILRALHKFKPFKSEPYSLEREWPRGHRKERSTEAVVVQTRFQFSDVEADEIAALFHSHQKPLGIEISKNYKGNYNFEMLSKDFPIQALKDYTISQLGVRVCTNAASSEELKNTTAQIKDSMIRIIEKEGLTALSAKTNDFKPLLDSAIQEANEHDKVDVINLKKAIEEIITAANPEPIQKQVNEIVSKWVPVFIYMDDHKPFQGIAYLDQLKQRKDNGQLSDQDKTFLMILEMAGLDFETEVKRSNVQDKEQRMLDMNDASLSLTSQLADHWSQRRYQVRFEADGNHVIVFVSDELQPALVPLNERSKGFQWFFSFDMTFLYETKGTFKNSVILLDEPGLHLHAAAQRDFLKRLKEYAKGNQLIYSTHMPFMIDMERLDNIRVCTESKGQGTKVSSDFYTADEHARFPLQAALGLSISQSLFVGQYNLVVEGITDFWLLSTMATILRSEGRESLNSNIVITPSGGATKAAYVGTMLKGQKLNVVVLLDSDPEGKRVAEGLIKQWIMKDRHVLLLGQGIGRTEESSLEDIFPAEFYLDFVNQSYSKELAGKPLTLIEINTNKHPQIVYRINDALKLRGFKPNSDGWAFNKGRPAKLMLSELPKRSSADIPESVMGGFEQLFRSINNAMPAQTVE